MLEQKLYLSVYEPIATFVWWGMDNRPPFGEGVEQGGRMLFPVTVLHIRHNLFAGTETQSLSVYKPIANRIWGCPPIWLRGLSRGSGVAPRESPPYYA